ncbi:succinate dehydrogenase, cytochrome b556 subunit [Chelatococcus sp. SYSU_G07232]|uniref:Succinate dehydrogenase cytochrome b556 subunit n=1 Tax=Chelatococcus albus TaxID=3047466 RepID=A0ABT7AFE2_9HYPH|nr:succinate dehydrogenase, cytochrome b556 subunit [Chelatococcus sp. SYSU_G07232]MDJ1157346.1 succinate dehydrogenase, cytochrome b556 subunit [Chelatococcus sp. SYSU_G07232]
MAEAKAPGARPEEFRPLSPHLQIYRWTWTMAMSVAHRITGSALYVGTLIFVWWLVAMASGPAAYATFQGVAGSWLGRLVLFGYTWALLHHMLGGLRHFVWDLGKGYDLATRMNLARLTLVGSIALALAVWLIAYAVR